MTFASAKAGSWNIRLNRESGAELGTGPSTCSARASTLFKVSAPAALTPSPVRNRRLPIPRRPTDSLLDLVIKDSGFQFHGFNFIMDGRKGYAEINVGNGSRGTTSKISSAFCHTHSPVGCSSGDPAPRAWCQACWHHEAPRWRRCGSTQSMSPTHTVMFHHRALSADSPTATSCRRVGYKRSGVHRPRDRLGRRLPGRGSVGTAAFPGTSRSFPRAAQGRHLTCRSTPTVTWLTGRSQRIGGSPWRAPAPPE